MTDADQSPLRTAAALRREFDQSFAQPPATELARVENFLAVRIGGDAYAMRVAEIAGLYADKRIVPLPSPLPSLLGTVGFRGQIAPVYDLAMLFGYPARPRSGICCAGWCWCAAATWWRWRSTPSTRS
jgi:hypothetical protein